MVCALFIAGRVLLSGTTPSPNRQVAITIDDLPAGAANSMSAAAITEMTAKLLTVLREQKVPAVGFVNERKLYKWSEVDERIGLKQFEDAVVQGEPVTTLLLAQRKMKLRYFATRTWIPVVICKRGSMWMHFSPRAATGLPP